MGAHVIEPGARVRLPEWANGVYITVTATDGEHFLARSMVPYNKDKLINACDADWQRLPDPLPTVPATNDVRVVLYLSHQPHRQTFVVEPSDYRASAIHLARENRLVAVWRIPANGEPERVEVTS